MRQKAQHRMAEVGESVNMFPFTQTRKESSNAWVNVCMESDHSHTAYRIRMPQPQAAYSYRVYGILALDRTGRQWSPMLPDNNLAQPA